MALLSGALIFLTLICCTFFPYFYLVRRNRNEEKHLVSLSICNCVACGIFISTCFLGLIPHVRHQESLISASRQHVGGNSSGNSSVDDLTLSVSTEMIVLLGFLTILLIEQVTSVCSHNHFATKSLPSESGGLPSMKSLLEVEAEDVRPLVDTTLDDHDDGMQDIEFRSASPSVLNSHSVMHSHAPTPENGISARTLFLLFGLSTHSLFEGIALGVQHNYDDFMNILIAVMFHEVLCCIAYSITMAQQQTPFRTALPTVLVLSASIPAGMIVAVLVDQINSDTILLRFILEGLSAGTFIYVACVEMLSAELSHSHAHTHSGIHGQRDVHAPSHSRFQGLFKAIAVIFGVFSFWILRFVRDKHY